MRLGFKLATIVAAMFALSDIATAQNFEKSLDVIDFLVDGPDLIGKKVTVIGCSFGSASSTSVKCQAPNHVGTIFIDSRSLERDETPQPQLAWSVSKG